jgi:2-succinyl-5-enolpyruvyl-6-hydroxy-3-cyclohexene-1-carboxylate synthase
MIDRTNRNTALASALVDELGRCGVQRAILSPGSRSSPVALALEREPTIEVTVVLDERSAGFLAIGCALESGKPAIVACTSGSAAANLHPAVVEADQAGVPMILLTSDRPPELRGIGAGQTIDQIGLYGSATRWFCEVGTHEADDAGLTHLRSTACRAFAESTAARGPVHLNLSWRDPLGPDPRPADVSAEDELAVEGRSEGRPLTVAISSREPSAPVIDALAAAIDRAERGLIVAGRHTDGELPGLIAALSAASGFPILAEPTSGLRFGGHDRDAVVSSYDLIARSRPAGLTPDLILRFGDMPTSKGLRAWITESGADQIVIDPPGAWNEPTRRAGALIRADAASIAGALIKRAAGAAGEWRERWIAAERLAQGAIDAILAKEPGPNEPAIHRALGSAFRDGDRVLLASSMAVRDAEAFMRSGPADVRFFSNRGANGIDGLISTAAGIATSGSSSGTTWAIIGDLALAHDVGGLAALASVEMPVRLAVIDNGGGGIFDFLPQAEQVESGAFDRLFTTPSNLDVERAAGMYGIPYVGLASERDLDGLDVAGHLLAHIRVERGGNVALHRRIVEAVESALAQ